MGRKLVCVAAAVVVMMTGRPNSTGAQTVTWQDVQAEDIEGMKGKFIRLCTYESRRSAMEHGQRRSVARRASARAKLRSAPRAYP